MNCLQRVDSSNKAYSSPQVHCICGLRVALGIIAACGFSVSIGAIVSYFPPTVGYAGGAITAAPLCAIALSYLKCNGKTRQVREELPLNSTTNSVESTAIFAGNDSQSLTIKNNNENNLRKKIFQPTDSQSEKSSTETVKEPIKRKKENHAVTASRRITPNINSLPQEVMLMVLNYLMPRELVAMGLTGHTWRAIAQDNVLWSQHCFKYLIPTSNEKFVGSYAEKFTKIQNLTVAIVKRETEPQIISFDKPVYSLLVKNGQVYLSHRDGIQVLDAKFVNIKMLPLSGFCKHRIIDRLEVIENILFCYHAPDPDFPDRKALLFSYDLVKNVQIKSRISVSLLEWEHGESKHRGGRLAFSEDKAFCNYANGDIRVWDLCNESPEYTDDIEYEDYNERLRVLAEEYGAHTDRYKHSAGVVESLAQLQEKLRRERKVLQGHTGQITHLSVSNGHLYSSSEDGTIKIWNIDTLQCIRTITTEISRSLYGSIFLGINHFLVNGNYIFGYMYDYKENHTLCKLWNSNTGICLQTLELNMRMDSYCLHGNLLFFNHESTIHIYDLSTGKEIQTLNCDMPIHKSYDTPALMNLQVIDNKLICIGKENELYDHGKQVFIFDFSTKL